MITNFYRWFANSIFRFIAAPDDGPAYFLNKVWRNEIFTHLFAWMCVVSLVTSFFYYWYLNGKNMPTMFDKRKHWWYALLINMGLNFFVVLIFIFILKLPKGNHLYCLGTTNFIASAFIFTVGSFFLQFISTSARGVPFKR